MKTKFLGVLLATEQWLVIRPSNKGAASVCSKISQQLSLATETETEVTILLTAEHRGQNQGVWAQTSCDCSKKHNKIRLPVFPWPCECVDGCQICLSLLSISLHHCAWKVRFLSSGEWELPLGAFPAGCINWFLSFCFSQSFTFQAIEDKQLKTSVMSRAILLLLLVSLTCATVCTGM